MFASLPIGMQAPQGHSLFIMIFLEWTLVHGTQEVHLCEVFSSINEFFRVELSLFNCFFNQQLLKWEQFFFFFLSTWFHFQNENKIKKSINKMSYFSRVEWGDPGSLVLLSYVLWNWAPKETYLLLWPYPSSKCISF